MSTYSNVTEQDLINLRKLAEQQKNQRAEKNKNRILKQRYDVNLAESLSPITKKLDDINKSTKQIGDINKKSQPETPQLAIENTPTTHQPRENNEGGIYHVELENTLNKMKVITGFLKTHYDRQRGWMLKKYPIIMLGETEVEINDNKYNITPGLQKVFTQTSNIPLKKSNDQEREIYKNIAKDLNFENYKAVSGENKSGRYKHSKAIFKNNLKGR